MKQISVIIRGKFSDAHTPWPPQDSHADVLLSDGQPYGYFGYGGYSPGSGMFMNGIVFDFDRFRSQRPQYVNKNLAKSMGVVSTICTILVDENKAKKFDEYWKKMAKDALQGRDNFNIIGNNCSSHAARAFAYAGLLNSPEIAGFDTPNNLFLNLRSKNNGNFYCTSGYIDIKKINSKYILEVETN